MLPSPLPSIIPRGGFPGTADAGIWGRTFPQIGHYLAELSLSLLPAFVSGCAAAPTLSGTIDPPRSARKADTNQGDVGINLLDQTMTELPGIIGGGMPRRNGGRKPGTTRGSPRHPTPRAPCDFTAWRLIRNAFAVREWMGPMRLTDSGPSQHNLHPSEVPGAEDYPSSIPARDRTPRSERLVPRGAPLSGGQRSGWKEARCRRCYR
jgi:hypothetical protein